MPLPVVNPTVPASACCAKPQPAPPVSETCCAGAPATEPPVPARARDRRVHLGLAIALGAWIGAYAVIEPLSRWLTFDALALPKTTHLGQSVAFFLYDAPKVL